MKESTLATRIMIAVLCVGVLTYLGLYFLLGMKDDLATTVAYAYSVDVGVEAEGILVRRERLLDEGGGYVDRTLDEGEKAAAGDTVARVYSDPSALDTVADIRSLTAELEQLRYALEAGTQTEDTARLDAQVASSLTALRALCARGDLSSLEDAALEVRTAVFRRDYTYGDLGAADQLSQLIADKQSELRGLERTLSQVSRTVRAPVSGVFSGETDGYETLITPDLLDTLTVQELSALLERPAPEPADAVGKLITESTWYLALLLPGGNDMGLTEGHSCTVTFSRDYYGDVTMQVERLEVGEEQTLAILSAREHLSDTTLLRVQSVSLVSRRVEGIRIPSAALRVKTETVTREDGSTYEQNTYGVYTVVGSQAEWQTVDVLYTGDTYYLVEAADSAAKRRLRAGDTVILSSAGVYDGKVVR